MGGLPRGESTVTAGRRRPGSSTCSSESPGPGSAKPRPPGSRPGTPGPRGRIHQTTPASAAAPPTATHSLRSPSAIHPQASGREADDLLGGNVRPPPAACRASLPRPHPHPSRALRAGGAPACSRPCRGRQTATRRALAGAARAQGTPVASQPLGSVLGRSLRLLAGSATRSRWGVGGSWARRGGRSHSGRRGTYTGRRLVDGPV